MKRFCLIISMLLGLNLLTGCGAALSPTLATSRLGAMSAKEVLEFRPISVLELSMGRSAKDGKLVAFDAAFDRYSYSYQYGETYHGYKLWDHDGNWLLCANIYTLSSLWDQLQGLDVSTDFNERTKGRLLRRGTFVKIEGAYHAGTDRQPPRVDVYFVNGQPLKELVSKQVMSEE